MRLSWAWAPVIAIGAAFLANVILILAATQVGPEQVSANAHIDARHFTEDQEAERRFERLGFRFDIHMTRDSTTFSLVGGTLTGTTVLCYRPDDAGLDRLVTWPDPSVPFTLILRPGPWRIRIEGTSADGSAACQRDVVVP